MARDLTDCPRGQTVSAFGSVPDDTVVASIDTVDGLIAVLALGARGRRAART